MKIQASVESPLRIAADALVLPVFSDGDVTDDVVKADRPLGGILKQMWHTREIQGREDEFVALPARGMRAKRVFVVGLGKPEHRSAATVAYYAGIAVRAAQRRGVKSLAFVMPELPRVDRTDIGELFAEGAIMATFEPAPYRTKRETPRTEVASATLLAASKADLNAIVSGFRRGIILGEAANATREMINLPANDMTPSDLAACAKELGKKYKLAVTVLDRPQMKKLGMGSFLSVAAGSDEPPKIIAIEYTGDKSSKTKLGLVGKGITFDTGGISLKPALDMDAMKGDMAGGATVIGVLAALAQLKPKVNVLGVICATENMPSGHATKPGDIVRAMNGKTIEITNTDAEGRLVLADGLCYARKLGATHMVDVATLTGAVVVALGHTATAAMSNDRELTDLFHRAAAPYGERYWELPLFPEYADLIKSSIADLRNSGGRQAGTIYGAMFLKEFVGETPWIHLDIAGTSWAERDAGAIAKGPSAVTLRPMVRLAELLKDHAVHGRADEAATKRFMSGASAEVPHRGNGKSRGPIRPRRPRV